MIELIVGIVFLLLSLIYIIPLVIIQGEINIDIIFFVGILWSIGLFLIVIGLKKIITNHKTEKLGEECYGQIRNIYPNGNHINRKPEFNADILVYVKSKNNMEKITETIGFDVNKYQLYSFIKGKYYNGDINIKEPIEYNAIPLNISQNFAHLISQDDIIMNETKQKRID